MSNPSNGLAPACPPHPAESGPVDYTKKSTLRKFCRELEAKLALKEFS